MLIKKEGDDEIPADRRSAASPHQGWASSGGGTMWSTSSAGTSEGFRQCWI